MNCPKCKAKLEVTHTYMVSDSNESRNLRCPDCGFKASSITFLVVEHGGAVRLRTRLQRGEIRSPLDDHDVDSP